MIEQMIDDCFCLRGSNGNKFLSLAAREWTIKNIEPRSQALSALNSQNGRENLPGKLSSFFYNTGLKNRKATLHLSLLYADLNNRFE